jgi:hypothetical protein
VLGDANVSTRKISDRLGHSKISMTQDRYLGRKLTGKLLTSSKSCWGLRTHEPKSVEKCPVILMIGQSGGCNQVFCAPPGTRTPNPLIERQA